jgi:hypothetical protein
LCRNNGVPQPTNLEDNTLTTLSRFVAKFTNLISAVL